MYSSKGYEGTGLTGFFEDIPAGVQDGAEFGSSIEGISRDDRNRDHLEILKGLTDRFPGNKISDFVCRVIGLDKLYLVDGLNCIESSRFTTRRGDVLDYDGFVSDEWDVWERDIGMLQYLFGLYYTSVCATGRRKIKYAVRDRKYITGWDAVTAKPYEVSTGWLDLGVMCCYHHTGFRDFLSAKNWFFWVEEQTGLVLYRKRFLG